jgi:hypothetical protein
MQKIFYRALVIGALAEKDTTPFEDWFVELARRAWGPDFEPIRTQGKHGDLKCDGHRISQGGIYQCYAPFRPVREKIENKIQTDFTGALAIWKEKMKTWQIVINDRRGLQAEATKQVEELRTKYTKILIETFGPIEIEKLALSLSVDDLGGLFNVYFGTKETELMRVSFDEIGSVVNSLAGLNPVAVLGTLEHPAQDKADHNGLDEEVRLLLTRGQVLAQRVERFFNDSGKVEHGERIGRQFAQIYTDMKSSGWDPNHIFFEFIDICGNLRRPPGQRMAVLAVVTYYFNQCDIFENPVALAS